MSQDFYQELPSLQNQFEGDPLLVRYLQKNLEPSTYQKNKAELNNLGELAGGHLNRLSQEAEAQEPSVVHFDPSGKRIDRLVLSSAWFEIEKVAAQYGVVATAYERKFGFESRILQMTKLYLFHPSSAFVSCPLAMTDGAARALELYGSEELKKNAFQRLTSRSHETFWTSGQWMTERQGGSDVGQTGTVAQKKGNQYSLTGTKWFTSATTSQMAMTLARIEGDPQGSRGLSLFYLETKKNDGSMNNIEILRLKDKLGTRAMPTAELSLKGTPATLIGEPGQGVKLISSLLNITRLYNATCAVAQMRRTLVLAETYAELRWAFGKKLNEHPLHLRTLQEMRSDFSGCFLWMMWTSRLLGLEETQQASPQEKSLLRLMTPLLKLYTAKKSIQIASEGLECFGGAGYIEDTHLPKLLRDAQVLAIWEGTTNVLALDFLRALEKEDGLKVLEIEFQKRFKDQNSEAILKERFDRWKNLIEESSKSRDQLEANARLIAIQISQVIVGHCLVSWARESGHPEDLQNWHSFQSRNFV